MKIYLAKSNRSNPEEVMWIRHYIKNYFEEPEVLEHTGGSYKVEKLLSADMVFVCTETHAIEFSDKLVVNVGRGLYSECSNFLAEKSKDTNQQIFLCRFHNDQSFDLHEITSAMITNIDNWISYGKITAELEPVVIPLNVSKDDTQGS